MDTVYLFVRRMVYCISLTVMSTSGCWVVKVVNLTDEKITIDINSTQSYLGWDAGRPVKRTCEFIGKQIDPHASQDFDYKAASSICLAPCTKSVAITSPVQVRAQNTLTSCSNVIAIVRKNASNQWNIEYHDWAADILKMLEERTRMPAKVRAIYDQFGDSPIQSLSVFRKPIRSGIRELIKTITENEMKHLNYDELYHTGFLITFRDQVLRLERNQTIKSDVYIVKPEDDKQGLEQRTIALPKTIDFNEFISNAMEGDANFWKYHPITNNCQLFVLQCLEKNNIAVPDELRAFIYQDAGKVLANSPLLKNVAVAATSLANRINNVLESSRDITIQNGTPYTIRVITQYAGESALLKSCRSDDFLIASGSEKSVLHGACLLEGIKVAVSVQGAEALKALSRDKVQQADMFAQDSFVGKGKASASFLIRSGAGKKLVIENMGNQHLNAAELQRFAAAANKN